MLKSFSSPRDKQVAPDAIAKTDWIKLMCHLPAKQSRAFTVFLSDSKRSCDVGLGYKTLAGNIAKFRDHDSMPMQIDLSQLDEGDGLENTLVRCKARCHKIKKLS